MVFVLHYFGAIVVVSLLVVFGVGRTGARGGVDGVLFLYWSGWRVVRGGCRGSSSSLGTAKKEEGTGGGGTTDPHRRRGDGA